MKKWRKDVAAEFKDYNKERDLNFTFYMKKSTLVPPGLFHDIEYEQDLAAR